VKDPAPKNSFPSPEMLGRILETANEGVWILDAHSRTIYVNPRLTQMLGYSESEMMGRSVLDFVPLHRRSLVEGTKAIFRSTARPDAAAVSPFSGRA
jgi:PAS domain S-box-containing protein